MSTTILAQESTAELTMTSYIRGPSAIQLDFGLTLQRTSTGTKRYPRQPHRHDGHKRLLLF